MIDGFLNKLCLELLKRLTVELVVFVILLCLILRYLHGVNEKMALVPKLLRRYGYERSIFIEV